MAHEYTVTGSFDVAGATTLAYVAVQSASTSAASLRFLRAEVSQSANNTSAMQRVQLFTSTSGGAAAAMTGVTPGKVNPSDAISLIVSGAAQAPGTAGINASNEGASAKSVVYEAAFNSLNGWLWVPTPKETTLLHPGSDKGFGVFFPIAPASLTKWSITLVYAEE